MSDSSKPHGLQHASLPCPSPSSEFAQVHVHWIGDAIQPSHSLSPSSPSAFHLSQHQGLFQWVNCLHQVAKVLELHFKQSYIIIATFVNNKAPTGLPQPPLSHPLSPLHSGHMSLLAVLNTRSLSSKAFAVDVSSACKLLPRHLHLCSFPPVAASMSPSQRRLSNIIPLPLLAGPMPAPIFLIKTISTWHMLELSKFSYSLFLWPKTWVSYLFYSWLYLSSVPGGEASYWA